MDIQYFIQRYADLGIVLSLNPEGGIHIQASAGVFTPEIKEELTQYKLEIITYLRSLQEEAPSLLPLLPEPLQPIRSPDEWKEVTSSSTDTASGRSQSLMQKMKREKEQREIDAFEKACKSFEAAGLSKRKSDKERKDDQTKFYKQFDNAYRTEEKIDGLLAQSCTNNPTNEDTERGRSHTEGGRSQSLSVQTHKSVGSIVQSLTQSSIERSSIIDKDVLLRDMIQNKETITPGFLRLLKAQQDYKKTSDIPFLNKEEGEPLRNREEE